MWTYAAVLAALAAVAAAAPQGEPAPALAPAALSQAPPVHELSRAAVVNADGSFNYSYELSNGIRVEEQGYVRRDPQLAARLQDAPADDEDTGEVNVVQGSFSYTAPDGTVISLRYIADENGFQPQGDHLPTPHPAIQRALAAIAAGELGSEPEAASAPRPAAPAPRVQALPPAPAPRPQTRPAVPAPAAPAPAALAAAEPVPEAETVPPQ